MADDSERDDEESEAIHFESEIDPRTGFAHNTTVFPAPPIVPDPPPPPSPTFLQRHPYLGPIIGSLIGAVILGTITIVLYCLGNKHAP